MIKCCFQVFFEIEDPILAAVALLKFKLKWVESQKMKDEYKQMVLHAMEEQTDDEEDTPQSQDRLQRSRRIHFIFNDNEDSSQDNHIEEEVNKECQKHCMPSQVPNHKEAVSYVQCCVAFKCSS